MNKIEYVGKCLLIKCKGKSVLVVGDLHLGYSGALRKGGLQLDLRIYEETLDDFEEIFTKVGKVDIVVVLGDIKHEIGSILYEERNEITKLFNYLKAKSNEIVVVKGNHDVFFEFMRKDIDLRDYFIFEEFAFVHGDRDFKEILDKKIKYWVMGHAHPAIELSDGVKAETYKCFLIGKYKDKEVIIVPSFFPVNEGVDLRRADSGLAWDFKINKFEVKIVDGMEVLDFGNLGKI